jgi:hypothetical protein
VADTSVAITPGSGAQVDARSQPGGDLRQVVTIGDGDLTPIAPVDAAGLQTRPGKAAASSTARVTAATSSTLLLAANTARLTATVFNDSSAELYLKYGSGATSTSKKLTVPSKGFWEMPPGSTYTGVIHGAWASATGAADIGEDTA